MRVTCPILVGRDEEYAVVLAALDQARVGSGSFLCVTAESGLGKTRLALEVSKAAGDRGMVVHWGASTQGDPTPYRPLAEALLAACPAGAPDLPELRLFRAALGQVVPVWGLDARPVASPVVVGEAVRRLLAHVAGETGLLLVLEDQHWADPDTLAVVDYLIEHLSAVPVTLLALGRPTPGSPWWSRVERADRAGRLVRLAPMGGNDVEQLVRAAFGGATPPTVLLEALTENGAGSPFLVEELLTAWRREGLLRNVDGSLEVRGYLPLRLPEGFAADIAHRLTLLPASGRDTLLAAAMIDLVLPAADLAQRLGLPSAEVHASLDAAEGLGLIRSGPSGPAFIHAMTRQAVLAASGTAQRATLAQRMSRDASVATLDPTLRAELALYAQDRAAASRALIEAGVRDRRRNALGTARTHFEKAGAVAPDDRARAEAMLGLSETLLESGHSEAARQVAETAADTLATEPGQDRARARILAARAAVAGRRWAAADEHLAAATRAFAEGPGGPPAAQLGVLRATVALEQHLAAEAAVLARGAVVDADDEGDQAAACAALELAGRAARAVGSGDAQEEFAEMLARAERAGLGFWVIRGLYQLGTVDLLATMGIDRLRMARVRAERAGALVIAAELQLEIMAGLTGQCRYDDVLAAGRECVETAEVLGLQLVVAKAWLLMAETHAKAGERDQMVAACERALAADDGPETVAGLLADCRAAFDLGRERHDQAMTKLDRAAELYAGRPALIPRPAHALRHLLRTVRTTDASSPEPWGATSQLCTSRGCLDYADAVSAGRRGDAPGAREAFDRGERALAWAPWHHHLARRYLAEAALADGWEDPSPWLEEGAAFFDHFGNDRVAGACRSLLRRTGRSVARPGRAARVPEALRGAGVTSREYDVLSLLADGSNNGQIADALVLSRRTVEHHVGSLLRKLRCESRAQLVSLALSEPAAPRTLPA